MMKNECASMAHFIFGGPPGGGAPLTRGNTGLKAYKISHFLLIKSIILIDFILKS